MPTNYLYGVQGNVYDPAMFQRSEFRTQGNRENMNKILQDLGTRPGQLKNVMSMLQQGPNDEAKFSEGFDSATGKWQDKWNLDANGESLGTRDFSGITDNDNRSTLENFFSGKMGTGYGSKFNGTSMDIASLANADTWAGDKATPSNPYGYTIQKGDSGYNVVDTNSLTGTNPRLNFSFDQDYNVITPGTAKPRVPTTPLPPATPPPPQVSTPLPPVTQQPRPTIDTSINNNPISPNPRMPSVPTGPRPPANPPIQRSLPPAYLKTFANIK